MKKLVLLIVFAVAVSMFASASTTSTATDAPAAGSWAATCLDPNSSQTITINQFSADMLDITETNTAYVQVYDGVTNTVVYSRLLGTTTSKPTDHIQDTPVATTFASGFTFPTGHKGCIKFTGNATNGFEVVNLTGTFNP